LSDIPVIEDTFIDSHNSKGYSYTLGKNEFFTNWTLQDAKQLVNNGLTTRRSIPRCPAEEEATTIVPEKYNWLTEWS